MKMCPKCSKQYDDTWSICLNDNQKLTLNDPSDNPTSAKSESEKPTEETNSTATKPTTNEKRMALPWKLMLLGFLVVIPTISFVVGINVDSCLDNKWKSAVKKQLIEEKADNPDEMARNFTLANVCSDEKIINELGIEELCGYRHQQVQMQDYSLITAFGAIFLFLFVYVIGAVGRIHRFLLVTLFTLGLYVFLFSGILLLIANGALAIFALYFLESIFIGRIHVGIMLSIGISILLGMLRLLSPALNAIKKSESIVFGKKLGKDKYPEIWSFVEEASKKIKALVPQHIVVGFGESFFVTESNIICLDGKFKGRTMFLSLPLMRQLEKGELLAIIGHELGHFRGTDTLYSQRFYPIYRGTSESIQNMNEGLQSSGAGGVIYLPVFALLIHFMDIFSKIESKIGRKRELIADGVGAELTSKDAMASALTKVCAYSGLWNEVQQHMIKVIGENKVLTNASEFYGLLLQSIDQKVFIGNLDNAVLPHPTDTHPPFNIRLEKLGYRPDSFTSTIKNEPKEPAIALIKDFVTLEKEISELEHVQLIKRGYATPPEENNGATAPAVTGNASNI